MVSTITNGIASFQEYFCYFMIIILLTFSHLKLGNNKQNNVHIHQYATTVKTHIYTSTGIDMIWCTWPEMQEPLAQYLSSPQT